MEDWDEDAGDEKRKQYEAFRDATAQRVSDIGTSKGSNVRSAQVVTRRLFESTGGDATKVTDDDIAKAYDEIDK